MTTAGIGFLFPGQGSQSVGMGRGLYDASRAVRAVYEEASVVLGYDVAQLCFEGPAERLNLTENTQPALLVSSAAALKALEPSGVRPITVAGHSLGEYSAVYAAGGLSFRDVVALVQKRGRYMAEAVPPGTGLVAALLGLSAEVVKTVCQDAASVGVVAAANFNSPGQVVIAGEKAAVERAIEIAKDKGCKKAIPLPVSVPVHTPLMQGAADRLAAEFGGVTWRDLTVPLVNNAEAVALQRADEIRASLVRQLPSSVRWEESVQAMVRLGVTTFVEVGPGTVLTGLVKRIVPTATTLNVHDPKSLETTCAALGAPSGV
ncbi:ACP S-malonyltransferase [Nitrospirales bacterium NOB]|nr:Malonyl CoA-acyl carrier protein transacylase [Nitrospirota bacterium]MCE7966013.1 [acyl-carrier-protein] S-malonyltransferase [Nitrospira sp. NTP2]MCK6493224.1 ACP S-malonyltransferase [Nitrospira sp.]MDL1889192.1 ACP S-malonyltransferase [Nitrospirales bacterium NOB]MEB2339034.1 ACP S-malonyltransferase [Nitrospirales bacterium]